MARTLTTFDTLPTVPAVSPARLTRQHFALYRGYLDGVSEVQLHASYGDASADVRSTRRLIAVLRDTLSVLARRAQDIEAAHLLRLRPGSIPDLVASAQSVAPALEEFRHRVDPDGVFGESELLDLYREAYPLKASPASDRRAARNARLRRRQAEALARMEASLVQDPKQDHPVDGWFEPAVAARLSAAGLDTIGDVVALIETKRHRWYTRVPRLGPKGAQRVIDWIRLHESALGHTVSQRALVPRRQWAEGAPTPVIADENAVAPLERLLVPAQLDGSKGTNRAAKRVAFDTDIRAITAWLEARSANEHTRRAYRREAERMLLWALLEKQKPLSSLDHDDCAKYITVFLADPQPAARWIAPGRIERCFAAWRPFAGPLSDRSRESARSILSAMFEWLIDAGYLAENPMLGLERASTPPAIDPQGRTLDLAQWNFVLASTEREAYTLAENRDRLALLLAYSTGLRRAELAAATTDALSVGRLADVSGPVWRLSVGNEPRSVLLAPAVMEALHDNLSMRGLPEPLACPAGTPILAQTRGGLDMTPDSVGKLFKRIFTNAGAQLDAMAPGAGRSLMQASTHWLRHTHSNHALAHGAALQEVSESLGHATVATTSLYLRHDDAGRYLGIEGLIRGSSVAKKTGK
ncbi:phage integrase family protein [Caballeronia sp. BR00000012568055]|uniref:phage integrase family protein n=1 Tax=Caballeronia sp. BR00000012568055 TaxID=2918761 RepID=UPI0023F9EC6C|nr:phage integrase family protein [Caballeronia sp. BR00000012568055]